MARSSCFGLGGLCAVLALVGCSGSAAPQAKAAPLPAPKDGTKQLAGSRISMWLPDGMYRPSRLLALRLDDPLLVVVLLEGTAKNRDGAEGFLAGMKDGAKLETSKPATRGNAKGFLGVGHSEIEGMQRQLLGIGEGTASAGVIVQYKPEGEALAQRILDSVKLDASAKLNPLALSGIQVGDLAGFELWNMVTQPIMFSEPGAKTPMPPEAPTIALMVMPYPKPEISDEELGQMMGSTLGNLKPNMQQAKEIKLEVDGKPTFAFFAPGENDGVPVGVFGFITRGEDTALAGFAHVGLVQAGAFVPRVERLVRSIKLDPAIVGPL